MYLGKFDFSTNIYVVKITSTKSSYHLENFDWRIFMSGFTLKFGNFLGSFDMGFPIMALPELHIFRKLTNFHVNPDKKIFESKLSKW